MNAFQYDEDYQSSTNGFLVGMMCGIAVGAVAALLFAPRPGAELRGQMADSMNRASGRAMDTYNRASETMSGIASRAMDLAENLSDRAAQLTAKLNERMSSRNAPPVS